MPKNTLSLTLNGEIPLHLYAKVIGHFDALVNALSEEVTGTNQILWEVADLRAGSAIATVRGVYEDESAIERVIAEYSTLAQSLKQRKPIPFSEDVTDPARAITSYLNGHMKSVVFGTPDESVMISEPVTEAGREDERQYAFGVITGVVKAISEVTRSYTGRPRIKLTVEDAVFGRVVACYLNEDQGELARKVWRSRVSVTGMIYRDPDTGRPISVSQITNVNPEEYSPTKSYRQARGVLSWQVGDEPSEVTIRRLRDAN